jgi:hypothetical protein
MKLAIAQIVLNAGTQARAQLNEEAVTEYGDAMMRGDVFPPIIVFYDGTSYILADGFHRVQAASAAGLTELEADVRQGVLRDAIFYSLGANRRHGVHLTRADKRIAIERLLRDEEWSTWSDRKIAETVGVNHETVRAQRKRLAGDAPEESGQRRYTTRHGTEAVMNVSNIAAANAARPVASPASVVPSTPAPPSEQDAFVSSLARAQDTFERGIDQLTEVARSSRKGAELVAVIVREQLPKLARIAQETAA